MIPRILISATRKSSGKTTLTIGLVAALVARGLDVRTFKKGPDFIDPMWLAKAGGGVCRNLDFFIMGRQTIRENFARFAQGGTLALIEGNHGLFDGQDPEGKDCSAALAELLQAPVLLVVDCQGASRGVAALVNGHLAFPGGERIGGVVLNNVASSRHEQRLRAAVERYCSVPILGMIPRSARMNIEERHLGLQPVVEEAALLERIQVIGEVVSRHVDLERILEMARCAPPWVVDRSSTGLTTPRVQPEPIRVAMAMDPSIHFYYPDNLEALQAVGVELIPFSLLTSSSLPEADGLYIGGGFPEVFMEALAANRGLLDQIRKAADEGMPIYAECGGLMVLAERIQWGERSANMVGALPIELNMEKKPVGYGYMQVQGSGALPWPGEGVLVACHEFHHSRVVRMGEGVRYAFLVKRGFGVDGEYDGLLYQNILACYAHFHAQGAPGWADFLAEFWRAKKRK
ncbi:MAG: cobyrinate a,c-diamide synthase [Magnetococcales bacterium]|nr:cobyrinate a,c-diamide synthase [Magnetococcales bacterium]MBF0437620.1 cobyrinate a,c-diamide synthase [Magnetococcales bacterium]